MGALPRPGPPPGQPLGLTATWSVLDLGGSAGELNLRAEAELRRVPSTRTVIAARCDEAALVLGSHQAPDDFDGAALAEAGVAQTRRPTGGGAVLVGPTRTVWVDIVLPAGDALWDDDVRRAPLWVGAAWARALSGAGVAAAADIEVWRGGLRRSDWSDAVCFAGLGPGEVTVGARKVVGVAQRRTRHAALFQTVALLTWEPDAYLDLMAPSARAGTGAGEALRGCAVGAGTGRGERLLSQLVEHLPG